jgi:response regulator of citrate/malate metabolism
MARRGLEHFLQNSPQVDLLLLDINMPDLDAWSFLDELVKNNISIPVVIITSSIDQDDIDKSKKYEMIINYIIKPITEEKIATIIAHLG